MSGRTQYGSQEEFIGSVRILLSHSVSFIRSPENLNFSMRNVTKIDNESKLNDSIIKEKQRNTKLLLCSNQEKVFDVQSSLRPKSQI